MMAAFTHPHTGTGTGRRGGRWPGPGGAAAAGAAAWPANGRIRQASVKRSRPSAQCGQALPFIRPQARACRRPDGHLRAAPAGRHLRAAAVPQAMPVDARSGGSKSKAAPALLWACSRGGGDGGGSCCRRRHRSQRGGCLPSPARAVTRVHEHARTCAEGVAASLGSCATSPNQKT